MGKKYTENFPFYNVRKTYVLHGRVFVMSKEKKIYEPVHKKTNNLGFRPGQTQTGLYSHRRWLEAGNFGFRK